MEKRWARWLLCAFAMMPKASTAQTPAQNVRLSQYVHTTWRLQDGEYNGIPSRVAQTKDGYLWVGTWSGLLRFDGVHFVQWTPPAGVKITDFAVGALTATSDGSLWIGSRPLARLKDGKTTVYRSVKGKASKIIDDGAGGVWVFNYQVPWGAPTFCHVSDIEVKCYGKDDGVTFPEADAQFRDESGSFWLAGRGGLLTGTPGAFRFIPMPRSDDQNTFSSVGDIISGPNGSILVGRQRPGKDLGLQEYKDGRWTPFKLPGFDGTTLSVLTLRRLKDGSLWIGTWNNGLYRVSGEQVEHFGVADGLSSAEVEDVCEDREGNIWVTTSAGIDRFRVPKVLTFSEKEGLSADSARSVLASRNGPVYIATDSMLHQIHNAPPYPIEAVKGLPGINTGVLMEDHLGRLWVNVDRTVAVLENGRFHTILRSNGQPVGNLRKLLEDSSGDVWALDVPWKLIRIHKEVATDEALGPPDSITSVGLDRDGTLLVTFQDGSMIAYKNQTIRPVLPAGGTRLSDPKRLQDGHFVGWVGYEGGYLLGFQGNKEQRLGTQNGLPCNSLESFAEDAGGTLWLYTSCGLIAIDKPELQKFWKNPAAQISYRLFDSFDGVHAAQTEFFPAASAGPDGKLWFSNGTTLQMVDPKNIRANTVAPPVYIEAVRADRKIYQPGSGLRLPRLTRDVEIDYTALSLSVPEKVHFRYRLEGHDRDWVDGDTRRQAFFTDLPPGNYVFRVIAANNDGVWNTTGATLGFTIPPMFYQTTWFKAVLFAVAVCFLWLIYYFRLRAASAAIGARLEERLRERERIASDLHDTLLQDFQAVILRFQIGTNRLIKADPNRRVFEESLDYADQVLAEGRDHIRDIRADSRALDEISESLAQHGEELSQLWPITFSMEVIGIPFEIDPIVRDEIHRIGREAMSNAFKHSNGSRVEVEITYSANEFRMQIQDDGDGIDAIVLQNGRLGHWGMTNMRKRSQKIGATLMVTSVAPKGTCINLSLSMRRARRNRKLRLAFAR